MTYEEDARDQDRFDRGASGQDGFALDELNSMSRDSGAMSQGQRSDVRESSNDDATAAHAGDGEHAVEESSEAGGERDHVVGSRAGNGEEAGDARDPIEKKTESSHRVGFAVFHQWRILPGTENRFIRAWEQLTLKLISERGALGSRLHRIDATTWGAYAQWPSRAAWERSSAMRSVDIGATAIMRDVVTEAFDPICLEPVCDHLSVVRSRLP